MRTLKVRMLDGTVKTMLVDDSQPVTNLMVVICTKIGTLWRIASHFLIFISFPFIILEFFWKKIIPSSYSLLNSRERKRSVLQRGQADPTLNSCHCLSVFAGITNHDEYSLVRENQEEEAAENKPNFGTLTLRRKKEEKEPRDQKMEQLKKKIKTDDEREWIRLFLFFF